MTTYQEDTPEARAALRRSFTLALGTDDAGMEDADAWYDPTTEEEWWGAWVAEEARSFRAKVLGMLEADAVEDRRGSMIYGYPAEHIAALLRLGPPDVLALLVEIGSLAEENDRHALCRPALELCEKLDALRAAREPATGGEA